MADRAFPNARSRRRLHGGDESGAALVEMAIAFPIFVFILYGLITFGVLLAQKQQITNAAADGARAAVGAIAGPTGGGPAGETQPQAAARVAQARVQQSLGSPGNYTASYVTGVCPSAPGTCITVDIVYDYAHHPLVPPAPGLNLFTPGTFHSTAVVQYG